MDSTLIIKNEAQAWDVLNSALNNSKFKDVLLKFDGWPKVDLKIDGEDFDGTIPVRFFEPIMEFQNEIYRVYTRTKYGHENIRRLTHEEKEALELIVHIKAGCSEWVVELAKVFNNIIEKSGMSGRQVATVLIVIAIMIAGPIMWKDWLESKERMHGKEISVQLSEQETERVKLITQVRRSVPEVDETFKAMSHFRSGIAKKLKPADSISVGGEKVIDGDYSSEIVSTPRQVSTALLIDGEFYIDGIKFPKEYGGKYRLSVQRVSDESHFFVDAAPDQLKENEVKLLRESSFAVQHVIMKINANELHGEITRANLVSIQKIAKKS